MIAAADGVVAAKRINDKSLGCPRIKFDRQRTILRGMSGSGTNDLIAPTNLAAEQMRGLSKLAQSDRPPTLYRVFLYRGLECLDSFSAAVISLPDFHAGRPAKRGHLRIAIPAPSCHCADLTKLDTGLGIRNEFVVGHQKALS